MLSPQFGSFNSLLKTLMLFRHFLAFSVSMMGGSWSTAWSVNVLCLLNAMNIIWLMKTKLHLNKNIFYGRMAVPKGCFLSAKSTGLSLSIMKWHSRLMMSFCRKYSRNSFIWFIRSLINSKYYDALFQFLATSLSISFSNPSKESWLSFVMAESPRQISMPSAHCHNTLTWTR